MLDDCFMYIFHWVPWASCQIRKIAGAHAPGMPGTFSLSPHVSDPDMQSRHVRDARAVMHAGIANKRFSLKSAAGGNVPGIPGACATCNFTYLVRVPLNTLICNTHAQIPTINISKYSKAYIREPSLCMRYCTTIHQTLGRLCIVGLRSIHINCKWIQNAPR